MYNVALKLHAIMNVKEHAKRGAKRQSDPRPRKELTCNWRRQQGQAILQYLYQNGIILIQTLQKWPDLDAVAQKWNNGPAKNGISVSKNDHCLTLQRGGI